MNYVELKLQFADSASLRLLRADNAPLLLAVLFAAFKHEHSSAVPESRLRAILEAELEELRDAGETVADKKAKDYLLEWSDQAHGYLIPSTSARRLARLMASAVNSMNSCGFRVKSFNRPLSTRTRWMLRRVS